MTTKTWHGQIPPVWAYNAKKAAKPAAKSAKAAAKPAAKPAAKAKKK